MENNIFQGDEEFNHSITNKIFTLEDLGIYLRFRFVDSRSAGNIAGISRVRVNQILIGYNLPKNPKVIKKLASAWGIDEIVLTQLFERSRSNQLERTKGEYDWLKNIGTTSDSIKKEGENG